MSPKASPRNHLRPGDLRAAARLVTQATLGITAVVEGVHESVWRTAGFPGASQAGRAGGITGLVYRSVRGITHGAGTALDLLLKPMEALVTSAHGDSTPQRDALIAVLNGVMGDRLAADGNPLATAMQLRHADQVLLPGPGVRVTGASPGILLMIHGLCMNERSWHAGPAGPGHDLGATLATALGLTPVYLRYNTGLSMAANARQLADLLERIAQAAPKVREWLPIGHSMGGLIARSAHALAAADRYRWAARTPSIVCLGSPHQGAPLEKLGHMATAALNTSPITRPLGRIANLRSQGIKDLRKGLAPHARQSARATEPALRLLFATLGDETDTLMGPLIGKLFGPQAVFFFFIPLFALCGTWMFFNSTSLEVYDE